MEGRGSTYHEASFRTSGPAASPVQCRPCVGSHTHRSVPAQPQACQGTQLWNGIGPLVALALNTSCALSTLLFHASEGDFFIACGQLATKGWNFIFSSIGKKCFHMEGTKIQATKRNHFAAWNLEVLLSVWSPSPFLLHPRTPCCLWPECAALHTCRALCPVASAAMVVLLVDSTSL